jgi:signal peptidase I
MRETKDRAHPRGHWTMNVTTATRAATASREARPREARKEGHRETIEAIVVAMILALLVRGFEAEAFVIPTGSMAPTLMGRHKEVTCPQCKYVYTVNASVEDAGGQQLGIGGFRLPAGLRHRPATMVIGGTCVNCRYETSLSKASTYNGDRILVMKFLYDMPFLPGSSDPERWDVVVFRNPEEPEVSYIKRLVGLPGEELRVWHGDIFIRPPGGQDFRLERKPLRHQNAMAMMVYDDRHRAAALWNKPEWLRWSSPTKLAWKEGLTGSFSVSAENGQEAELRYRNLVPDPEQWEALLTERELPRPPRSTLITDFYSYNTNETGDSERPRPGEPDYQPDQNPWGDSRGGPRGAWLQPHWVGDLSLSARLDVKESRGKVRFELVEGGVSNRCDIDLVTGMARLFHGTQPLGNGAEVKAIGGEGSYQVTFTNFDNRLTLQVDGKPIFGDGLTYDDPAESPPLPTQADLAPAAVRAMGATIGVSDLVLKRDIYYTLNPGFPDYGGLWNEGEPRTAVDLFDGLADPARFAFLANLPPKDFKIGVDRFLMLGDNSPMSKDSRAWTNDDRRKPNVPIDTDGAGWDSSDRASWEVPRKMITGKAFFVYWPHGMPFGPDIRLGRDFRVLFRPYVERMKWIR